jgi:TRAP-type uncharacterized transport system substrate-binding protein
MGGARAGAGLFVVLAVGVAFAACSPTDPPGGDGRLSIATGGSGGVYQVYGGGLAALAVALVARLALGRRTAPA